MKKIFITYSLLLFCFYTAQTGNVGISTDSPSRNLDVNGNIRVRTLTNESTNPSYNNVIVANSNGELEKWDKTNIMALVGGYVIETKKIAYSSNGPNINNTVACGKFEFRFNTGSIPQIRLVTPATATIYFTRIKKSNNTSSGANLVASNNSINYTAANNVWSNLDSSYLLSNLEEIYLTYPNNANVYRLTFLARTMSPSSQFYTMICEKF